MKSHRYNKEIQSWLKKARDDLTTAEVIVKARVPAWAATFHCQQSAEKALKALLLFKIFTYPKEHNLTKLAKLIHQGGVSTKSIDDKLEILTHYYVGTRYPTTEHYETTRTQAKKPLT